jgi:large subunit ribosomal protein L29
LAEKKPGQRKGTSQRKRKPAEGPVNLDARLRELQEELFRLRFQFATRQLTNTARIREVRREIARVKTRQRQQELVAQVA